MLQSKSAHMSSREHVQLLDPHPEYSYLLGKERLAQLTSRDTIKASMSPRVSKHCQRPLKLGLAVSL